MLTAIHNTLRQLKAALISIAEKGIYSAPVEELSGATIGQHTRHIIELYQCLLQGYEQGCINYDKRKRDHTLETDAATALLAIDTIVTDMQQPDKRLQVETAWEDGMRYIESSYYRELLYNLEHGIHHQALIKVALIRFRIPIYDENFGVASSTINYRKTCVQ